MLHASDSAKKRHLRSSCSSQFPLQPMEHGNSNQTQPPYYYQAQSIPVPLYTPEVYLPDASTPAHVDEQAFSQHLYQQTQQHEPHYPYERFQQRQQPLQLQQQQPRSDVDPRSPSHPQQSFHQPLPSSLQQQHHEQLRHAHAQQALPCASPPLRHSPTSSGAGSSPRPTRSSPSEASTSYLSSHSDPLSALRNDLQVHAAATALTQATSDYSQSAVPRLPPILQVEKQQVTTTATQAASASRRRNEATFRCPVPGCGSTFTRRFNLKGHLRSHTSERPYVCEWPGCGKGFARQHDCKRHYQLHSAKTGTHMCQGCGKSFSRTDALNRHLRSEGGLDCRIQQAQSHGGSASSPDLLSGSPPGASPSESTDEARSRPPSV